jgi:NADH-quinone oxidoreductase subunit A
MIGAMLTQYFPVLIFFIIAVALGVIAYGLGNILGPHHPDKAKVAPYECGFDHFEDARLPFDVRFYLVAILFIIFDLETAFLFPWAIVLRHIGWAGFGGMMLFLAILIVGFIYEWKKGALEWE